MADVMVKRRVDRLEDLMADLLRTVDRVDQQLAQTDRQLAQTDRQLAQTDQQLAQTDQQLAQTDQQLAQTDQQLAQTDRQIAQTQRNLDQLSVEMREFREDMRKRDREFKREMGELSRKMGTMVEDMVVPSLPRILHRVFGCTKDAIEFLAVRVKKMHPVTRQQQEYDVVVVCGDYLLINETKDTLNPEKIQDFVDRLLSKAREFFPEYAGKKIIGVIASLYVDESIVRFGERLGLIVLGFGEDVMNVLNQPGFVPKVF
jgi:hypothetical protein